MGYLDHSTNNIILDAVLTDYGRQRLSAGGAFNIASYALGDDEIDYSVIKKYGRTVGKEKIEKNTPIFEAMTNPSIALKYKLIGREDDGSFVTTAYLPVLQSSSKPQLAPGGKSKDTITVNLYYNNTTGASVPAEFLQTLYQIKVSDRFFTLSTTNNSNLSAPSKASSLISAGDPNRIATYEYNTKGLTTPTSISFDIQARSIDSTTLLIYGKKISPTQRRIDSYITVIGMRHGCTIDIPVSYTATL